MNINALNAPSKIPLTTARAHALLHVTVFIWGFTAILGRLISLSALNLVLYRMLLAALMLGAGMLLARQWPRVSYLDALKLLATGGIVAAHWACFYGSIKLAGISVAVVCLSSGSFFVSLLEPLFNRRRIRGVDLMLGLAATLGVLLLVNGVPSASPVGIALGIASAFFSGLFSTINGRLIHRFTAAVLSLWELGTGALLLLLVMALSATPMMLPRDIALRDWGWLIILSLLCTVVPWLWSLRVMRTLSAFTVLLAVNLEPVYSLVLAWILFPDSERLSAGFYIGAALLLGLVAINGLLKAPERQR